VLGFLGEVLSRLPLGGVVEKVTGSSRRSCMAEWVRVASTSRLRGNGCVHTVTGGGEAIVLARWDGEIFALEDRCSHQDFPSRREVEDGKIECVFHGAKFDLRTGKAVALPPSAGEDLPRRDPGDEIFVQVD
jgi:3-phenylpropionate/trans-cinnamate dioxygenase ferredoxin component